ncbi:MAG TPA: GNAT family N-acetyltransferase [Actinophytocola sp.]|jgi:GNAT superfamily N-acetyltransferase|uniref:GNAT family N-acetyltransferase n=1 Tax=Actinophytocola sp. TaxID=1872138 RepID=UPI002E0B9871|nr:GNAT family N-acetyltransferase [Actinophytocola sp.]
MAEGRIRAATENDLPTLQEIERAAGRCFADIGMSFVAEDEPPSIETLLEFERDGRAWVWVEADDRPVAYLIADVVDGNAHLEQVSVHPGHARRRIGRALMAHMMDWARARDLPAVTLTTYTAVEWNGPYYERCGFRYLSDTEITPGLRRIRAIEAAHGLDQWPRACMRLELCALPSVDVAKR